MLGATANSSADALALKAKPHAFIASALRTLETEREGVAALAAAMSDGLGPRFVAAVDTIRAARGRVIVTGMGKSGHVARKIAATLASTGTPAFFVHAADASHGDLGMITSDDVMLVLSWSGETEELKDLINYSRRFRIALIAITVNADSTLGKSADIVLVLPQAREACPHNLAPTTSSLMQLALGDALAIALLESRGFTAVDFGVFHPGGKLGAALKFVRDVMHPGSAVPLIGRDALMSEAIVEMSAKGFGCVAVTRRWPAPGRRHRRRPAPPHARRSAAGAGRRGDDGIAENGSARAIGQRGSGTYQFVEDHGADRGGKRPAGRHRAFPRSLARRRRLSRPARGQRMNFGRKQ
jgi:arabinose-5-phosphate isomerase